MYSGGYAWYNGNLNHQGERGHWWSYTWATSVSAYRLGVNDSALVPQDYNNRASGFPLRPICYNIPMIYHILVKPGSHADEVQQTAEGIVIRTRKKAHDGEANTAVIKLLADFLGVPKTRLVIKSGATSRHKTIEVIE